MLFGVQWYYWLILAVAVIILIFAWYKALASGKKRRERLRKEAEIWKRDYDLRQKFSVLTEAKLKETENSELLHGVAMNIQVALENAPDMAKAFEELSKEKQYIYALEYFDEDCKTNLSSFFKSNGKPLVPLVPDALFAIGAEKYIDFFKKLYPMYDEDSEISIDYQIIAKVDEEFASTYNSTELCLLSAEYIKKNKEIFIN